jgi:hypothetical protein
MTGIHGFQLARRCSAAAFDHGRVLLGLLALCLMLLPALPAQAIEPVKIGRDDTALDLTATTEIYNQRGEAFQVSTAAGADGIVRRIEVRANSPQHSGDWAVFALANVTDEQIDRLIVAPHFRLVASGLLWPDLGSARILGITPSEGLASTGCPAAKTTCSGSRSTREP